jgi:hypothetical protein
MMSSNGFSGRAELSATEPIPADGPMRTRWQKFRLISKVVELRLHAPGGKVAAEGTFLIDAGSRINPGAAPAAPGGPTKLADAPTRTVDVPTEGAHRALGRTEEGP